MKINVSFKENEEEIKLYMEACSHSDKSAFLKDTAKFYLKYKELGYKLDELLSKNKQS